VHAAPQDPVEAGALLAELDVDAGDRLPEEG
jgi:hypothetical protein